jgi:hypothetical protein
MRASVRRHVRSGGVLAIFRVGAGGLAPGAAAELVIHGMEKTADSLVLGVDLWSQGRTIEAGRLYTYGEGSPSGRPEARFEPVTLTLDVSDALGQFQASPAVTVKLRIMDPRGAERGDASIFISDVELRPRAAD